MCCRTAQPADRLNGLAGILRSKSSAAIACSLFALATREGAPQARQVADRFHLLQNLRETIETQLSRADRSTGRALLPESKDEDVVTIAYGPGGRRDVAEHRQLIKQAHRRSRQAVFDQIRTLRDLGNSIGDIARETGFGPHSIRKWLKFSAPPDRRATAPKPCSPSYFFDYLSRRWAEGCVRGRELFREIKLRGYTGSFWSGSWRSGGAPEGPESLVGRVN